MPLYQYFQMNDEQKLMSLLDWANKSQNDDVMSILINGIENELLDAAAEYVDNKYNGDFENEEEREEIIGECYNELISDLRYNPNYFVEKAMENRKLFDSTFYFLQDLADEPKYTYEAPAWLFFDNPKLIKNTWLVHFSNNAYKIATEGFTYGTTELDRLAYSGCGDIDNKYGEGYDFAFTADAAMNAMYIGSKVMDEPKYGNEFVLFRANGVEVFHKRRPRKTSHILWPISKNYYLHKKRNKQKTT